MIALQEWHNTDKSDWPTGEWKNEPDKRQWIDDATGLPCLMVRGPLGNWCGYVGVHSDHPWHGKDYSHNDVNANAHGGLTFADGCQHGDDPTKGICHIPAAGEADDIWWFGFDCAHLYDLTPRHSDNFSGSGDYYRNQRYVENQATGLARQIAEAK